MCALEAQKACSLAATYNPLTRSASMMSRRPPIMEPMIPFVAVILVSGQELRPLVFTGNQTKPVLVNGQMVMYSDVEKALPDGTPDLSAPSNFYIKYTSTAEVLEDSSRHKPLADGTTKFRQKRLVYVTQVDYKETGPACPEHSDLFTTVRPMAKRLNIERTGMLFRPSMEREVSRGYRLLEYFIRTEKMTTEVRTYKGKRIERSTMEVIPSFVSTQVRPNQDYDPFRGVAIPAKAE